MYMIFPILLKEGYFLPLFATTKGGAQTFYHLRPMLQIPVFTTKQ